VRPERWQPEASQCACREPKASHCLPVIIVVLIMLQMTNAGCNQQTAPVATALPAGPPVWFQQQPAVALKQAACTPLGMICLVPESTALCKTGLLLETREACQSARRTCKQHAQQQGSRCRTCVHAPGVGTGQGGALVHRRDVN
jgi:hypothetical protein